MKSGSRLYDLYHSHLCCLWHIIMTDRKSCRVLRRRLFGSPGPGQRPRERVATNIEFGPTGQPFREAYPWPVGPTRHSHSTVSPGRCPGLVELSPLRGCKRTRLWRIAILLVMLILQCSLGSGRRQLAGFSRAGVQRPQRRRRAAAALERNQEHQVEDRRSRSRLVFTGRLGQTGVDDHGHRDGKEQYAVCLARSSGKVLHDIPLFHNDKPPQIAPMNSYASPSPVIEAGRVYVNFGTFRNRLPRYGDRREDLEPPRHHLRSQRWAGLVADPGRRSAGPANGRPRHAVHHRAGQDDRRYRLENEALDRLWRPRRRVSQGILHAAYDRLRRPAASGLRRRSRNDRLRPGQRQGAVESAAGQRLVLEYLAPAVLRGHGDGQHRGVDADLGGAARRQRRRDREPRRVEAHQGRAVSAFAHRRRRSPLSGERRGIVSCIEAKTGESVWQKRVGGKFVASPVAADGRVYLFGEKDRPP